MVFGKLFGGSKTPEPTAAAPPGARPEQSSSPQPAAQTRPVAEPISQTEREEYGYLQEAVARFGLDKLTTPGVRDLMASPLADANAQVRRVTSHPNFRTALHEMADHADAEEEQIRLLKNLKADIRDFGREGLLSPEFLSVLKDTSGSNRDYLQRIFRHPEAMPTIRRYEAHREKMEAAAAGEDPFLAFIADVEDDAFGDPNHMLTYTDTRPKNWDGVRYRHIAHYRRIAGTMNDREKFVYLMAHATRYFFKEGLDSDTVHNEFALRVTCALYGGGKGDQEWAVDPGYKGDNADDMLEHAKERFDPWPVDKYFNHGAKVIMDLHATHPEAPLARWGVQKLRPHSAGWATSR